MAKPNYALSSPRDQGSFALCDASDTSKQIQFDASALATAKQVVIQADASNDGKVKLPPFAAPVLAAMNKVLQRSVPTEASTVTIAAATQAYVAVPAGGLTTLTVVLPATPADGTKIALTSTQAVTNLVLSSAGSDTLTGAPTALTANSPVAVIYYASGTTWYRTV